MNRVYRLGVDPKTLVTRKYTFEPASELDIRKAIGLIDEVYGVECVTIKSSHLLVVDFDARRTCTDCILGLMSKAGVIMTKNLTQRIRTKWYRFVEKNIQDNLTHEPWKCH
jgi:hypothetical protein